MSVKTKMVIVIRKDLNMRKGKMAAQASHASMKVFFDKMYFVGEANAGQEQLGQLFNTFFTPAMLEWLTWEEGKPGFTKIVVSCEGEEELKKIEALANEAGIPNAIILDNGLTEFGGVKTYTCIALGPDDAEKIDKITGGYPLL